MQAGDMLILLAQAYSSSEETEWLEAAPISDLVAVRAAAEERLRIAQQWVAKGDWVWWMCACATAWRVLIYNIAVCNNGEVPISEEELEVELKLMSAPIVLNDTYLIVFLRLIRKVSGDDIRLPAGVEKKLLYY